ncbi:CAPA peptides-like isoform X2 [Trichoplusia ni]|uniref:CAPA peptides-like isoform X2 n=1 Tax=Trichoplusia ni TaxID=7111 RepID=A0A7E5W6M7_TRINI|nr:CAPA peptides-like isoform X2 [Trichoplusia ni]
MQSTMKFVVAMVMLASALASAYNSDVKLRRDGMLNLYPFPRVGRVSRNTWQIPIDDVYNDYETFSGRRQQENHMKPFPRSGRSALPMGSPNEFQPVAVRRTESPGMWFGPRLGRSFKSDDGEN